MLLGVITLLAVVTAVLVGVGTGNIWLGVLALIGAFVALLVLAFGFFFVMCKIIDPKKPQEKDSRFYRALMHLYVDAIITLVRVKITVKGAEKMPAEGRIMLVSNHRDNIDPAFLLTCFRKKQLAFISKREVQDMFLVGTLMHKILCQPINRENDREALKTIQECIRLIKEDEVSIAVFPEGYIHDDRLFHPFRPGVFKIAQRTKVPIVVCTLHNTLTVFQNAFQLKRSDVQMNLLAVIQPEEYAGITTVELANRIHDMMAEDLGPELVYHGEG